MKNTREIGFLNQWFHKLLFFWKSVTAWGRMGGGIKKFSRLQNSLINTTDRNISWKFLTPVYERKPVDNGNLELMLMANTPSNINYNSIWNWLILMEVIEVLMRILFVCIILIIKCSWSWKSYNWGFKGGHQISYLKET